MQDLIKAQSSETVSPSKVLIADDDPVMHIFFRHSLPEQSFQIISLTSPEAVLKTIQTESPDIVFLDVHFRGISGLDMIGSIHELNPALPIIIITGDGTVNIAIRALHSGAFDYLVKPLTAEKIIATANAALSHIPFAEQRISPTVFNTDTTEFGLIGNSQRIQEVYRDIAIISRTPPRIPTLILGETGTGKEIVARAIHKAGNHASAPFIAINCAAIPDTLLESELFGYEKGAFTGALRRKAGRFEAAGQGTIFLDEIGDISAAMQVKLLRVLQERTFERLGGNESFPVQARFIAATHRDLKVEVQKGNFREDLYYRLNVATISMPPLRERPDDILRLAQHFLKKHSRQHHKRILGFDDITIKLLKQHIYPGNIRELENLIERAVMLTNGSVIMPESVQPMIQIQPKELSTPAVTTPPTLNFPTFASEKQRNMEIFEKEYITKALKFTNGNVARASMIAGMTRQNFHRLMAKYGINFSTFRQ
jgi:DNA-binding NtrC family response regulator